MNAMKYGSARLLPVCILRRSEPRIIDLCHTAALSPTLHGTRDVCIQAFGTRDREAYLLLFSPISKQLVFAISMHRSCVLIGKDSRVYCFYANLRNPKNGQRLFDPHWAPLVHPRITRHGEFCLTSRGIAFSGTVRLRSAFPETCCESCWMVKETNKHYCPFVFT
jgi:hypothetical protein